MKKINKGDKIKIPTKKTDYSGTCLEYAAAIQDAAYYKQDFLYVVDFDKDIVVVGVKENLRQSTFRIDDVELYEEFKLPESWAIRITSENKTAIINYVDAQTRNACGFYDNQWMIWKGDSWSWTTERDIDYAVITTEEFKKYISKQEDKKEEMKLTIIGYKAPTDLFGGKVPKGTIYKVDKANSNEELNSCGHSSSYNDATTNLPKEIVETWEPVYNEINVGDWIYGNNLGTSFYNYSTHPVEIVEISESGFRYKFSDPNTRFSKGEISETYDISQIVRKATPEEVEKLNTIVVTLRCSNKVSFNIEVVNGEAWYMPEYRKLSKEWIKFIIDSYNNTGFIGFPYSLTIDKITVGCMENTYKEDWEKVYNLLN